MTEDGILVRESAGLDLAERLLSHVRARAHELDVVVAAAVVDEGGNVVALTRMDGAGFAAARIALGKAATATALGAPTDAFSSSTQPGRTDWGLNTVSGGELVVLPGGVPIRRGGRVIGGLGVSGATGEQDLDCARFALASVMGID